MHLFDFQDSNFTEQWWHMVQYVDMPRVYTVVNSFNNKGALKG